jgi:pimeloyl-ACP methyl ester carboxylesterase
MADGVAIAMAPRVQYATTADGLSIAFSATGEGTALVHMLPMPFRHVQAVWDVPEERRWMERVGRTRNLVQYDPRGMGLSERAVVGFSLDALVLDIEAVVEPSIWLRASPPGRKPVESWSPTWCGS